MSNQFPRGQLGRRKLRSANVTSTETALNLGAGGRIEYASGATEALMSANLASCIAVPEGYGSIEFDLYANSAAGGTTPAEVDLFVYSLTPNAPRIQQATHVLVEQIYAFTFTFPITAERLLGHASGIIGNTFQWATGVTERSVSPGSLVGWTNVHRGTSYPSGLSNAYGRAVGALSYLLNAAYLCTRIVFVAGGDPQPTAVNGGYRFLKSS